MNKPCFLSHWDFAPLVLLSGKLFPRKSSSLPPSLPHANCPSTAVLRNVYLHSRPLAGIWELGCRMVPYTDRKLSLNDKSGSLHVNNFVYKQCGLCWILVFLLGIGFWHYRPLIQAQGTTGSLTSFPGRQHLTNVVTLVAGGNKHVLCDSTGKGLLAVCIWLPPDFSPCTSSLCWLCPVSFYCNKS